MRIYYDIDSQYDFINKNGALYVPDAESIRPNLKLLNDHAVKNGIVILSSVDRHFGTEKWKAYEGELKRWGGPFSDHCMDGTPGGNKIPETQPIVSVLVENDPPNRKRKLYNTHELENMIHNTKEVRRAVFEKQSYSIFPLKSCPGGNAYFELFLNYLKVEEAVVYGVATDYCVKAAVFGFCERGIHCFVVEDAIKGVAKNTTYEATMDMKYAGARFVETEEVIK